MCRKTPCKCVWCAVPWETVSAKDTADKAAELFPATPPGCQTSLFKGAERVPSGQETGANPTDTHSQEKQKGLRAAEHSQFSSSW